MCTVSFVKDKESFIFTSNRDEHIGRPLAFKPEEEIINDLKVIYPKDPKAGGSWFAVNERQVVTVLLNGAFKKHRHTADYRRSRGLVLLDIISSGQPKDVLLNIPLERIEPFTIVLYEDLHLYEFRWDGNHRFFKELDPAASHIWSSTTLYTEEIIRLREELFLEFMSTSTIKNAEEVLKFHSNDYNDPENGFVIDRANGLKTFSITQAVINPVQSTLRHLDLINRKEHLLRLDSTQYSNQL